MRQKLMSRKDPAEAEVKCGLIRARIIWAIIPGFVVFGNIPDGWTLFGSAIVVRISSQFVSDRPRLKIGRCRVTGKAISCQDRRTATLQLVECHTRYVILVKVVSKDTRTVVSALIRQARKLPSGPYKSLTWIRSLSR